MEAKKLSKHLSKMRGYDVLIGLNVSGRLAGLPLIGMHLDDSGRRVVLLSPPLTPAAKPNSGLILPAGR